MVVIGGLCRGCRFRARQRRKHKRWWRKFLGDGRWRGVRWANMELGNLPRNRLDDQITVALDQAGVDFGEGRGTVYRALYHGEFRFREWLKKQGVPKRKLGWWTLQRAIRENRGDIALQISAVHLGVGIVKQALLLSKMTASVANDPVTPDFPQTPETGELKTVEDVLVYIVRGSLQLAKTRRTPVMQRIDAFGTALRAVESLLICRGQAKWPSQVNSAASVRDQLVSAGERSAVDDEMERIKKEGSGE